MLRLPRISALIVLPLMAFGLSACDGVRGLAGPPSCEDSLLEGVFSHDNMEDLRKCLDGGAPLGDAETGLGRSQTE